VESTLSASEAARKSVNAAAAVNAAVVGATAGLDHEAPPIESVMESCEWRAVMESGEWCGSGFDGEGGRCVTGRSARSPVAKVAALRNPSSAIRSAATG
jgi:hypothetical protein